MATAKVGFAGHDRVTRERIVGLASSAGFSVTAFASLDAWLAARCEREHRCLVVDVRVPRAVQRIWMDRLGQVCGDLPVLVIVDRGDVDVAVRALKRGAADILETPAQDRALVERILSLSAPGRAAGP